MLDRIPTNDLEQRIHGNYTFYGKNYMLRDPPAYYIQIEILIETMGGIQSTQCNNPNSICNSVYPLAYVINDLTDAFADIHQSLAPAVEQIIDETNQKSNLFVVI